MNWYTWNSPLYPEVKQAGAIRNTRSTVSPKLSLSSTEKDSNLTDAAKRRYGRNMIGRRLLPLLLAAVVFILQDGECFSALFASPESRECCRKGHCSKKNPDPCCQISSKLTSVQQDQIKEKAPLPELAVLAFLHQWTIPVVRLSADLLLSCDLLLAPSPPGQLGNFSLPLLV